MEYKNISKKTLQESIESEMSGDVERLLVAIGNWPFFNLKSVGILEFNDFSFLFSEMREERSCIFCWEALQEHEGKMKHLSYHKLLICSSPFQ